MRRTRALLRINQFVAQDRKSEDPRNQDADAIANPMQIAEANQKVSHSNNCSHSHHSLKYKNNPSRVRLNSLSRRNQKSLSNPRKRPEPRRHLLIQTSPSESQRERKTRFLFLMRIRPLWRKPVIRSEIRLLGIFTARLASSVI